MTTLRLIPAALAGLLLGPLTALAATEGSPAPASPHSVSANIGVVSNYIWRGVTQTDDGAAVQGGLDYSHASGFYAGTWASNIDWGSDSPNYELDLYLGFGGSIIEDLDYDLNVIYYAYPDGDDADFSELAGSLTYKWFTLGMAYTFYGQNDGGLYDDGDLYYHGGFEFDELPYGLGLGLRVGYTDFDNDGSPSSNYWQYGASISKDAGDFGTFSLNWDQNDGDTDAGFDDDPKIWVGWLKEF